MTIQQILDAKAIIKLDNGLIIEINNFNNSNEVSININDKNINIEQLKRTNTGLWIDLVKK